MKAERACTVADAMLRVPKTCDADTTIAQARDAFRNDHVHSLLIVDGRRLLAVIERTDVQAGCPATPALLTGRLAGRIINPQAALEPVRQSMITQSRRRLAVVDGDRLLGLLCLKRTGSGFCSDADIRSRGAEREALESVSPAWIGSSRACGGSRRVK